MDSCWFIDPWVYCILRLLLFSDLSVPSSNTNKHFLQLQNISNIPPTPSPPLPSILQKLTPRAWLIHACILFQDMHKCERETEGILKLMHILCMSNNNNNYY